MIDRSEIACYLIGLWNHEDEPFFLFGNKSDVSDDAWGRVCFNKGPNFIEHLLAVVVEVKIEVFPFDGFMMQKMSIFDLRTHEFAVFVFNQMGLFRRRFFHVEGDEKAIIFSYQF